MFHLDFTAGFQVPEVRAHVFQPKMKLERRWFAVTMLPQLEESVVRDLNLLRTDSFPPTSRTADLESAEA